MSVGAWTLEIPSEVFMSQKWGCFVSAFLLQSCLNPALLPQKGCEELGSSHFFLVWCRNLIYSTLDHGLALWNASEIPLGWQFWNSISGLCIFSFSILVKNVRKLKLRVLFSTLEDLVFYPLGLLQVAFAGFITFTVLTGRLIYNMHWNINVIF